MKMLTIIANFALFFNSDRFAMKKLMFILCCFCFMASGYACTSMLVSAKASATGRPMMWKHRDTGAPDNFIARMSERDGHYGYVALYNGGDSLLQEAWMGMNDAGFAIMNTASYNLAPDTAKYKDREGELMSLALAYCRTVSDFEDLLENHIKPMGVQANFGVMDAEGGLAYFETDDYEWTRYDVSNSDNGVLVRTNYSISGVPNKGHGYVRYDNAFHILKDDIENGQLSPISFTEKASRSFWHSLKKKDCSQAGDWIVDQDFIPRYISTASIVIEGVQSGQNPNEQVMWAALGYPPCAVAKRVTLTEIPAELGPDMEGWHSSACIETNKLKSKVFPLKKGNGPKYIDMKFLRTVMPIKEEESMEEYRKAGYIK